MTNQQYLRYEQEADQLTKKGSMTGAERARAQFLMSAMKTMREFGMTHDAPTHDAEAFRKKFFSQEARTYTPLAEASSPLVPSAAEVKLKSLMLPTGPLYAGSPLLSNILVKEMTPGKVAVSNDVAASSGYIVGENGGETEAELANLTGITVGGNPSRYSTGILLASVSLAEDVAPETFGDVVLKLAGPRLSKVENVSYLSTLKTALAANSSAAVAAVGGSVAEADVYALVGAVSSVYRANGAAFVMSAAMQAAIGALKTSAGARVFPNAMDAQPSILGYALHVSAACADSDAIFGDFSYLFSKSKPVELRVLRERYRVEGFYGYVLAEQAEAKWSVVSTSDSPVKYLTFA